MGGTSVKVKLYERMAFRFEELRIWQDALRLCNELDAINGDLPGK